MFTDIVGYTALMGEDEDLAFQLLNKNRQLQRPIIEKYEGTWLKEIGDGILASFPTDTAAVNCAKEILDAKSKIPELQLRIGIHEGEVIFEKDDVFGDGVNIASRLQTIAPADCIYISETVNRNIENKRDIETRFVKQETLKNVKHPVRIYQVFTTQNKRPMPRPGRNKMQLIGLGIILILSIILIWQFLPEKFTKKYKVEIPSENIEKSIAVLPFIDMSPEKDQEYFSDGISEEILNHLCKIKDLQVASRTSSFAFKGKQADIKEIGAILKVETILEGSVRKYGNQVRITVQLVNVADGFHQWSETYDREFTDIFTIQSEIASKIASALRASITNEEQNRINKVPTENLEAYENYLKAGKLADFETKEDNDRAIGLLKKSIQLDPEFSQAWARLGSLTAWKSFKYGEGQNWVDSSITISNHALLLDPESSPAYNALGTAYIAKRFFHRSIGYYHKALFYNPNAHAPLLNIGVTSLPIGNYGNGYEYLSTSLKKCDEKYFEYTYLGLLYSFLNEPQKAEYYLDLALKERPDWLVALNVKIILLFITSRNEEAMHFADSLYVHYPDDINLISWRAAAYWLQGDLESARQQLEVIVSKFPMLTTYLNPVIPNRTVLAFIYQQSGKSSRAKELLEESYTIDSIAWASGVDDPAVPYNFALINQIRGNTDQAYYWLNMAIDKGFLYHWWCMTDPIFEDIRNESMFLEIVDKMKEKIEKEKENIRRLEQKKTV